MPTRRPNHNWRAEDSSHETNRNTKSSRIPKPWCISTPRRSHPSVRARNRNQRNPLPTRNSFAGWITTFWELFRERSVNVDDTIADLELAISTPTADPRGDKQKHREWPGDRARGRSRGLMRAEIKARQRFLSQRAAITGGQSPVTSVSDCGCRSRGRT